MNLIKFNSNIIKKFIVLNKHGHVDSFNIILISVTEVIPSSFLRRKDNPEIAIIGISQKKATEFSTETLLNGVTFFFSF